MDNNEFRRIVLDTPRQPPKFSARAVSDAGMGNMSLGSRMRSSIPMTPRTVKGGPSVDFARQLAERNAASQPQKKFRSSAAPKGTKLAAGYQDRSRLDAVNSSDDREARIRALEEQVKLGQLGEDVFEKLRDEITGGDIGATHLVKGLDRKLLERVKRGEDVMNSGDIGVVARKEVIESPSEQINEELDKLEQNDFVPVTRQVSVKNGDMAPPPLPLAGTKRTRNDILAELKASRKATRQPQLSDKFRKITEKRLGLRIVQDKNGNEVLITVDEHGNIKRKVKRVVGKQTGVPNGLLMPDQNMAPLGMIVPELPPPAADAEDADIFEGVGDAYNPLGDAEQDSSSSASDQEDARPKTLPAANVEDSSRRTMSRRRSPSSASTSPLVKSPGHNTSISPTANLVADSMPPPAVPGPSAKKNYFKDDHTSTDVRNDPASLRDPTILAALKRAAAIVPKSDTISTDATTPSSSAAKRLLSADRDRDLDDMDLGFGSSRYDDEDEDGEAGGKVKLSEWRGAGKDDVEDDDRGGGRGGKQRKRGKKKKVGDKNSAKDILGIMEGRKVKS